MRRLLPEGVFWIDLTDFLPDSVLILALTFAVYPLNLIGANMARLPCQRVAVQNGEAGNSALGAIKHRVNRQEPSFYFAGAGVKRAGYNKHRLATAPWKTAIEQGG